MDRKRIVFVVMFVVAISAGLVFGDLQKGEEALVRLLDGNKRFIAGVAAQKDISDAKRKELAKGQSPSAIVVACSDSRVSPEIIFDQGLGDVFVVRVAGNVLDPIAMGSVEYAAEHLHSPLLVILGHEKCGAVAATLDAKGKPEGNIGAIVNKIMPAVKKAKAKGGTKEEMLNNSIKENVLLSKEELMKKSPIVKHLVESGELKVVTGVYRLASGDIELLNSGDPQPQKTHKHAH
ncbi:MAG: carbonic anhydrase [Nitrospirae bacterium]|nr:MAG: carbonic anhydrase [Nitrospirota bacterium]